MLGVLFAIYYNWVAACDQIRTTEKNNSDEDQWNACLVVWIIRWVPIPAKVYITSSVPY
jgi:hypothetical protein